jgi:hypothetical protein
MAGLCLSASPVYNGQVSKEDRHQMAKTQTPLMDE